LLILLNKLLEWLLFHQLFQEEEQKRLEQEMQKRRERIERWRAERKKKELEVTKKEIKGSLLGL
jgi:ATP-dependent RNA helicase DDX46/PRP5